MRTIVVGDTHGCYNELKTLIESLEKKGEYNKKRDKLIFLGDYIDRGTDSRLVIKYIRNLQKNNKNVIALKGNHEDMLLDYYNNINEYWLWNGASETKKSYEGFNKQFNEDMEWMKTLPLYHEDKHFIYVHAGIDASKPMKKQDKETLLWIREPFIYNNKKYNKKVIFGHTPTLSINRDDKPISTFADHIGIDTGCVYGGSLTALIIEGGEIKSFYQVEKMTEQKNKKNA